MARLLLRDGVIPDRIVDPSAGAGALLIAVLDELNEVHDTSCTSADHARRLYGVELDPVARELACLLVWLAAGSETLGIGEIADRIVVGNAITRDWRRDGQYGALIMNPPWESLRHKYVPADIADERERTIERLRVSSPARSPDLPPLFSQQGRGDRNLFKAFTELAPHLVRPGGRMVALVPGAWSSDLGTQQLRHLYLTQMALEQWTSFENRGGYFPIDSRYKFGVLSARRSAAHGGTVNVRAFATNTDDLEGRHVELTTEELVALGDQAAGIPDITSRDEAALMLRLRRSGTAFFDPEGPIGPVKYRREVDLTLDRRAGVFRRLEEVQAQRSEPGVWKDEKGRDLVPLLEGRMVGQYECFEKSWVSGRGRRAVWSFNNGHRLGECQPQFLIERRASDENRVAICDVTSATNTRTVLATVVPNGWVCGNTAPALYFAGTREALAGAAILNSMVFDWQARRMMAGLHLNKFYLAAMTWPRLAETAIDELAMLSQYLHQMSPRWKDAATSFPVSPDGDPGYVRARTRIEEIVASGFQLRRVDLREVFDPNPGKRRGFWRSYASDPHASAVAESLTKKGSPQLQMF